MVGAIPRQHQGQKKCKRNGGSSGELLFQEISTIGHGLRCAPKAKILAVSSANIWAVHSLREPHEAGSGGREARPLWREWHAPSRKPWRRRRGGRRRRRNMAAAGVRVSRLRNKGIPFKGGFFVTDSELRQCCFCFACLADTLASGRACRSFPMTPKAESMLRHATLYRYCGGLRLTSSSQGRTRTPTPRTPEHPVNPSQIVFAATEHKTGAIESSGSPAAMRGGQAPQGCALLKPEAGGLKQGLYCNYGNAQQVVTSTSNQTSKLRALHQHGTAGGSNSCLRGDPERSTKCLFSPQARRKSNLAVAGMMGMGLLRG